MDIQTFFQKSTGKWFCQCTSQHLGHSQSDWQRNDTWITLLPEGDSTALKLCEQFNIDPSLIVSGISARWEGIMGKDPSKKTGSSILVAIDNAEAPGQGTLLRQSSSGLATTACYMFEKNETLVVMAEQDGLETEERLWFASDKLRLRTSVLKRPDDFSTTSFFSEIRVGDA